LAIWPVFAAKEATLGYSARCGTKGCELVNRSEAFLLSAGHAQAARPLAGASPLAVLGRTQMLNSNTEYPAHLRHIQANWWNERTVGVAQTAGVSNGAATQTSGS
jgi:hypothetical protein